MDLVPTTPPAFTSPEARYLWVYAEREKGRTLTEIAKALGVSQGRAGQMNRKGSLLANPPIHWHTGLSSQTANRLVERGYSSREQVEKAVTSGEITDRPSASQRNLFVSDGQQTTVPGLGKVGFGEILVWLGLEPNSASVTRKPTRKDLLRVVCELQDLIGEALAAHDNDRDPDSQLKVRTPLAKGFDLCVQARSFDPPSE